MTEEIKFRKLGRGRPVPVQVKRNALFQQVADELDSIVGLDDVKNQLDQLLAYARVTGLRKERRLPTSSSSLHMVFKGPPGTGKTEIARKIGRLLKAAGLLRTGELVEVDRATFVAGYQGQTAKAVTEKFNQARGGVLFIDEAYSLAGITHGSELTQPDAYGREAIDTMLKRMEDMRDQLVVIVAGYPEAMNRFLASNVGLASRFSLHFHFDHYAPAELMQIFEKIAEENQVYLQPEAAEEVFQEIEELHKNHDETFGNGREMRRLFERTCQAQAYRLAHMDKFPEVSDEELMTLTVEDVRVAFA